MCVIAQFAASEVEAFIASCLRPMRRANPHGEGIAWARGGRVRVWRRVGAPLAEVVRVLRRAAAESPDASVVYHARIATCGAITAAQCHPFRFGSCVLFHNGHLRRIGVHAVVRDSPISDTCQLARRAGAYLRHYSERAVVDWVVGHAGKGNVLAVMKPDGVVIWPGNRHEMRAEGRVIGVCSNTRWEPDDPEARYMRLRRAACEVAETDRGLLRDDWLSRSDAWCRGAR